MTDSSQLEHPILILVRGLPGSGKTYLAHQLQKELGEGLVVMLDPDATDYSSQEYAKHVERQNAEGVDPKLHAYRFLRAKAYRGIAEHKIVIWNQPFTNLEIFNKMVERMEDCAKEENTSLPILVVEVEVDPETAKRRVSERKQAGGHGPSDSTFERFINDYKSFTSEGYNTVTVNGADELNESVAKVLEAVNKLQ